jgi:hypothetical protein
MRTFMGWGFLFFAIVAARAQGTPPMDPSQVPESQGGEAVPMQMQGSPPVAPPSTMDKMTSLIKKQVNKAIDGKPYPELGNWHPLTTRQKFDVFLTHTYSPMTFAGAGVDAIEDTVMNNNPQYQNGVKGLGEHYGVELGTSETGVFFEAFLVPAILKQDPRYFRNPSLPFARRALYAISRVLITRADSGRSTLNASRIVGGAASQSLADLYVPGAAQGMHPIVNRVTFDLARDAGFNLLHEFWPDLRRKFLHR